MEERHETAHRYRYRHPFVDFGVISHGSCRYGEKTLGSTLRSTVKAYRHASGPQPRVDVLRRGGAGSLVGSVCEAEGGALDPRIYKSLSRLAQSSDGHVRG